MLFGLQSDPKKSESSSPPHLLVLNRNLSGVTAPWPRGIDSANENNSPKNFKMNSLGYEFVDTSVYLFEWKRLKSSYLIRIVQNLCFFISENAFKIDVLFS